MPWTLSNIDIDFCRIREKGNALFFVLIAVALFAALSYAITQSSRGSGSVTKEKVYLQASQVTSHAQVVKSAVTRLLLTGTAIGNLQMDVAGVPCTTGADCVYAKEGGAVPYAKVPYVPTPGAGDLYYYVDTTVDIPGVGTALAEVVLFTFSVPRDVCEAINKGLGLGVPVLQDSDIVTPTVDAYPGQAAACFENEDWGAGTYTYYHVLVER